MKSKEETKPFEPTSVAVSKLYETNQRLQRKNAAHKQHIRHMQAKLENLRLKYELLLHQTAYKNTFVNPNPTTLDQRMEETAAQTRTFVAEFEEHA